MRTKEKYEGIYRMQIFHERRWKWGLNDYTIERAQARLAELKKVGIKARVRPASDFYL
mgnify:CR=1 FL=1